MSKKIEKLKAKVKKLAALHKAAGKAAEKAVDAEIVAGNTANKLAAKAYTLECRLGKAETALKDAKREQAAG